MMPGIRPTRLRAAGPSPLKTTAHRAAQGVHPRRNTLGAIVGGSLTPLRRVGGHTLWVNCLLTQRNAYEASLASMSGQSAGSAQATSWVGFPMVWRRANVVHGKLWFWASGRVGFDAAQQHPGAPGKSPACDGNPSPAVQKPGGRLPWGGHSSGHVAG